MMKDMTDLEIILGLECSGLTIEDMEDWNRVKDLAKDLSRSQGFYGRLYRNMENFEEEYGTEGLKTSFPINM